MQSACGMAHEKDTEVMTAHNPGLISRMATWLAPALMALAFAAAPSAPAAAAGFSLSEGLSRIVVDTAPLARLGQPELAANMRRLMGIELAKVYAGQVNAAHRSAPTLLVHITGVSFSSSVGGDRHSGGSGDSDYLEGNGQIVDAHGNVLATFPILSALPTAYSGAWYQASFMQVRYQSIVQHFAWWLHRQSGF